jgi:DegV family protein with EDD domain
MHTDTDAVFTLVSGWGVLEKTKAEDMRAQHRGLKHGVQKGVAIVADSSADLPDAVLDRHGIHLVPLQIIIGGETFQDRLQLHPEEFYRRMRTSAELPTTSQPTVGDFVRVYRNARHEADEVVAVLLSSALSGTFQSGAAAIRAGGLTNVRLFDSRSASLGLGLLALRAAELAEQDWPAQAIVEELRRVRNQSGVLLTVDRFDNLLRSGRVTKGKAWLGGLLDVKPILSLDDQGRWCGGPGAGPENVVPKVCRALERRLTPRPRTIRFGIVHAEAPEWRSGSGRLVAAYRPRDCFISLATGVLGTHVRESAWAVFYQIEDGTPPAPPNPRRPT